MVYMKILKRNQIIVFILAFMLITAGYVNYNNTVNNVKETASLMNSEEVAGIGDAQLVNSNNVIDENEENELKQEENNAENPATETNTVQTSVTTGNEQYFISSKLERDKMYSQMLETYQKILENSSISEEQKGIAQTEISKIQSIKNSIMIAENLIKNKGFTDLIIFVNDNSISVIVDKEKLEEAEIAQIQNIIVRELNADAQDIHISTK